MQIATPFKNLMFLCFIFCFSACRPGKMAIQGLNQDREGVLLQQSYGHPAFIYLQGETAFFEFHQVDKPSFFCCFDTLTRLNDTVYQGKTGNLTVTPQAVIMNITSGRFARKKNKQYNFSVATAEQIKTWEKWKNEERVRRNYSLIHPYIFNQTGDPIVREKLVTDWYRLVNNTGTMSIAEFDAAFKNFGKTYSVNIVA